MTDPLDPLDEPLIEGEVPEGDPPTEQDDGADDAAEAEE